MEKKNYLSSLTSLRGIAAFLVIVFHFDIMFAHLVPQDSNIFIRRGYLWVDFFFILSGFIMLHVYGKLFMDGIKTMHLKRFIRARFARIYPLHLFSFLCVIALYFLYKANFTLDSIDALTFNLKSIPTNLLLLQSMGFYKSLGWNIPSWSISTEWWMYIIFPFILIPFNKIVSWRKRFILFFIIVGYIIMVYYLYPLSNATSPFPTDKTNSLDMTYDFGFFRCFLGFIFGMLIYELYKIQWGYSYLKKGGLFILTSISAFIALSSNLPDFVPVILFAIIVLMGAYAEGVSKKFLNLKPLLFLGDISYSIYLMHMPILLFLAFLLRKYSYSTTDFGLYISWLYFLAFAAIVILISTLSYNFIETPMRKKLNPVY
jgi:peptidoglycan/LPS O-acetylase OafA/YrhL